MRESLREFIYREAGPDEAARLDLVRHLAPSVLVAGGFDFNELRQLENTDVGSEYVSATWPEVPVVDPLPCITIRPFNPHGYTTAPYELVALLARHLRDVLAGAEAAPDYDCILRFGYIEPENMDLWKKAAERWRASQTNELPLSAGVLRPVPIAKTETAQQRRERRYQMCIAAGIQMPTNDYAALPRGINELARKEGITRQAFSEDLKAYIRQLHTKIGR